jgi:hypothetical protein
MAVSLTWRALVDTDLDFTEFSAGDHSYVLRFMAQFPHAYEGPMVAENGTGLLCIGMGHYAAAPASQTKLLLAFGGRQQTYPVTLDAGRWYHLAVVVATGRQLTCTVYLDGAAQGSPLTVPGNDPQLPQGTLRLGRRSGGQTVNGQDAQFFGLLDDVAVFTTALTQTQVQALISSPHLTGSEADLLAGYPFTDPAQQAPLNRPTEPRDGAAVVAVSANRDSAADRALLPLPVNQQPMDLPFPPGEAWFVIQGNDDATGSHSGLASFCWDFDVADQPQNGVYPKGSDGAPFYACAAGRVITVLQTGATGTANIPNIVEVEQAPSQICGYLHVRQNGSSVASNDQVAAGTRLGLTGDTGVGAGAFHVHLAATDKPDRTAGFVTFPVALSDYEVRVGSAWQSIARGMPTAGQVLRNPPTPTFSPRGLGTASAIARDANHLDVAATDTNGRLWIARWTPGAYARNWDRWRPVLSGISTSGTPASLVARASSKLDVFASGADGKTYTAAWDANRSNGLWRGWWNILSGWLPPGGSVTAVCRDPGKLDVFLVSNDGGIYTAAWDRNVANQAWRGWWRIGTLTAKPGAPVSVVSRAANKLDVFVAGIDGKTYTAAWDTNQANGQWRGWWNILSGWIPPGGTISAVARDPGKLDIFLVSNGGGIYTAAWDRNVANQAWRGWWRIGNLTALPGAPVSVVARDPSKLDIFVAGTDGQTYTAAWDANQANGQWRGWWNILTGAITPGGPVAAVSRDPGKLDIFIVSTDNAVYTAAWDANVAGGQWRGWWRIGDP